ncbi:MAG: transcriptional repressor [Anaerolineae bacterium]|nr:MAG: transcriptional repressor [Anaerolineae bacterium]
MTHHRLNYVEALHAHGYRVTPQRVTVLDAVCRAGGHARPAQILALAREGDLHIDRSTVYRSLEVLVKAGLVLTAPGESGIDTLYEIVQETPHHHLRCTVCGRETELDGESAARLFENLERETGYRLTGDHLMLTGVCPECQASSNNQVVE